MQCQKLKTYMETGRVIFLPTRSIRPSPMQPRTVFSQDALAELADSIRLHGVLQPLSVRRASNGYELIAGERRLRAAQLAGLGEVPCLILQMDDRESALAAMVENLQRQDLDFVEEALGIAALMEAQGLSQEQTARLLGKSQSAVANKLRLLKHGSRVLDLGCGCGTLGLLLLGADRTLQVCGIELQEAAAWQARENAEANGLSERMHIVCGDLRQTHDGIASGSFDCALSNPPYYPPESGYLHTQDSLCAARSELCCPFDALCAAAARALRWGGRFFLVHKPERLVDLMTGLRAARLEPKRIRFVRHRAESAVNLVLIESRLGGKPGLQYEPDLILYTQSGELTAEGRRIYHLQE